MKVCIWYCVSVIKALVSVPNLKPDKLVHSKQACEEMKLSVVNHKWKMQRTHFYSVSTLGVKKGKELLFCCFAHFSIH